MKDLWRHFTMHHPHRAQLRSIFNGRHGNAKFVYRKVCRSCFGITADSGGGEGGGRRRRCRAVEITHGGSHSCPPQAGLRGSWVYCIDTWPLGVPLIHLPAGPPRTRVRDLRWHRGLKATPPYGRPSLPPRQLRPRGPGAPRLALHGHHPHHTEWGRASPPDFIQLVSRPLQKHLGISEQGGVLDRGHGGCDGHWHCPPRPRPKPPPLVFLHSLPLMFRARQNSLLPASQTHRVPNRGGEIQITPQTWLATPCAARAEAQVAAGRRGIAVWCRKVRHNKGGQDTAEEE